MYNTLHMRILESVSTKTWVAHLPAAWMGGLRVAVPRKLLSVVRDFEREFNAS